MTDIAKLTEGLEAEDVKRLSFACLGRVDCVALCRLLLAEAIEEAKLNPNHEINTFPPGAVDQFLRGEAQRQDSVPSEG